MWSIYLKSLKISIMETFNKTYWRLQNIYPYNIEPRFDRLYDEYAVIYDIYFIQDLAKINQIQYLRKYYNDILNDMYDILNDDERDRYVNSKHSADNDLMVFELKYPEYFV